MDSSPVVVDDRLRHGPALDLHPFSLRLEHVLHHYSTTFACSSTGMMQREINHDNVEGVSKRENSRRTDRSRSSISACVAMNALLEQQNCFNFGTHVGERKNTGHDASETHQHRTDRQILFGSLQESSTTHLSNVREASPPSFLRVFELLSFVSNLSPILCEHCCKFASEIHDPHR